MACWLNSKVIRRTAELGFFLNGKLSLNLNKHAQFGYDIMVERQLASSTHLPQLYVLSKNCIHNRNRYIAPAHRTKNSANNNWLLQQSNGLLNVVSCQFSMTQRCKMGPEQNDNIEKNGKVTASQGIFQRFKDAYKEYGKVLVSVHVATSIVWYGSFVYAAASGLDIVPFLHKMGASETIIRPFQSGAGNFAVAYLLYKLATPARYTVTITGTQLTVRKLREWGYMEPASKKDSIRNLMKDSKSQMKTKYEEKKGDIKTKYEERKDDIKTKYEEKKDDIKEKVDDFKSRRKGKDS